MRYLTLPAPSTNPPVSFGWRVRAALSGAALLSACSSSGPVSVEVRTVEVPVASPCITRDQLPAEPARVGSQLTGNAVVDLAIVAASALELRKWGGEQAALLAGCVE
jgi:hypothetical protein